MNSRRLVSALAALWAAGVVVSVCQVVKAQAPGGRAPNLCDRAWLNSIDDARITSAIMNGVPNTEMPAFGTFSERPIFEVIQYIRNETAIAAPPQGQEVLFDQFGRVRDVVQAPDGYFYIGLQDPTGVPNPAGGNLLLSASTPGRIVRLMPCNDETWM